MANNEATSNPAVENNMLLEVPVAVVARYIVAIVDPGKILYDWQRV